MTKWGNQYMRDGKVIPLEERFLAIFNTCQTDREIGRLFDIDRKNISLIKQGKIGREKYD
jgi:hypothetical protein